MGMETNITVSFTISSLKDPFLSPEGFWTVFQTAWEKESSDCGGTEMLDKSVWLEKEGRDFPLHLSWTVHGEADSREVVRTIQALTQSLKDLGAVDPAPDCCEIDTQTNEYTIISFKEGKEPIIDFFEKEVTDF